MRGIPKLTFAALVFALLLVPFAAYANTNLGMQMSSGASTVTVCDNNIPTAGCTPTAPDEDPTLGNMQFNGAVQSWNLNTITGSGPPVLSVPNLLDLSAASVSTTAGGAPITFLLTVTGLIAPFGTMTFSDATSGTSLLNTTTITVQTWISTANTAFCANVACGTQMTNQVFSGTSWSGTTLGTATTGVGPYSLTMLLTIDTHGLADTVTFDPLLSVVPEPETMWVLSSSLLALALSLRLKVWR